MRFRRFMLCTASVALFVPCAFAQTARQQDTFPYPPTRIQPNAAQAMPPQVMPAQPIPSQAQRPYNTNRGPVDPRRDYINSSSGQRGVQATGRSLDDYRMTPPPRTQQGQQPQQQGYYPPAQPGQVPPQQGYYPPSQPNQAPQGAYPSRLPPAVMPVQDGEYMAHEKARQFNARQETERMRLKCNGGDKLSCNTLRQAGQPVAPPQQPVAPDPRQYRMPPGGVAPSQQGYGIAPPAPIDQPGYTNQPPQQGYGQQGEQEFIPPPQPSPHSGRLPPTTPRYYQDMKGRVYHDPIPMEHPQGR